MTDEQGEPLFVLKDICDALDLGNPSMAASRLDEDGVSTTEVIDNLGCSQKTNVVTEAGLYEVIIRSDKPEAKAEAEVAALGRAIETAEGDLTPSAFGKTIPMQDAVNRGILILTERIDPTGKIRPQLLVTPAGQTYFTGILSA